MPYDLIVIGGGPAGMLAAGRAAAKSILKEAGQAANGTRVLLLEKNGNLGKKLLITGKGRCNVTNAEADARAFTAAFGPRGKFLFSSFSRFGSTEAMEFFERLGIKMKVERGGRVFPASDKSVDVLNALIWYLKVNKAEIKTGAEIKSLVAKDGKIEKVILSGGEELRADNFAVCVGGQSYPLTGSTGDGYRWLAKLGHSIVPPRPALVPVIVREKWVKELEGLSLKNVEVSVWFTPPKATAKAGQAGQAKKIDSRFGEALFTADGMSGPVILDLSGRIGELLDGQPAGGVELKIDFKPALDADTLDKRIQGDFRKFGNKMFKNSLDELLPQKLIPVIIRLSGIDPEKKANAISRDERKNLLRLLKEFSLAVKKLDGWDKAIVTAGGVDLREVDPKTMRSKIVRNLFLAGEILDLAGPTGGYNLQACWSEGWAIGENFG